MKVSIITPSFNQALFIEKNIISVLNQNYPEFEHIIVDGGSHDNTVEILKKYKHLKWVSEKDKGQADALNKGLIMASGDIIGWLNSDDYYEENIFQKVTQHFKSTATQWLIGNITIDERKKAKLMPIKSRKVSTRALLKNPNIMIQPPAFFRTSILKQVGGWNSKFFMAMDFDLWIRLCKVSAPKMVNCNYAYFTVHEDQKSNSKNIRVNRDELIEVMRREGALLVYILKVYFQKTISMYANSLLKKSNTSVKLK